MARNFPNLVKCINIYIPEAQSTPSWVDVKRSKHVTAKMVKVKDEEKI